MLMLLRLKYVYHQSGLRAKWVLVLKHVIPTLINNKNYVRDRVLVLKYVYSTLINNKMLCSFTNHCLVLRLLLITFGMKNQIL